MQPISQLALPQCLLGGEAQLSCFVAANAELADRLFFAPMPEIFASVASLYALWGTMGVAPGGERGVHLRFGGTRNAKLLKDMRNGMVLAEDHVAPPITASRHPFASGLVLPAQFRRVFAYDPQAARPHAVGTDGLPVTPVPPEWVHTDLPAGKPALPRRRGGGRKQPAGLEIVSLGEFHSAAWAAGPVRAASADLAAAEAEGHGQFVLVPWNLNHPGSAVPALLERMLCLQTAARPAIHPVLLPYNYPGQTGLIRRVVRQVRLMQDGPAVLGQVFVARLSDFAALPLLLRLAGVAWVDGNDPEFDWTTRRLQACGFAPILLAAGPDRLPPEIMRVPADDALTVTTDTRFGLLHFRTHLPSLRGVRHLLPITRELGA